jgi:hypothetical protein
VQHCRRLSYLLQFDAARKSFVSISAFSRMATYSDSLLALQSGATVLYSTGDTFLDDVRTLPGCHTSLAVRDAAP